MRRKLAVLAAGVAAVAAVTATALAVVPGETPFPSPTIETLFVATNTYTGAGERRRSGHHVEPLPAAAARSSSGVRRRRQDEGGPHGGRREVRLRQDPGPAEREADVRRADDAERRRTSPARGRFPPAIRPGSCKFTTRFQTKDKEYGNFVQIPVATSQLTIVTVGRDRDERSPLEAIDETTDARDRARGRCQRDPRPVARPGGGSTEEARRHAVRRHGQRRRAGSPGSPREAGQLHADERLHARRAAGLPRLGHRRPAAATSSRRRTSSTRT